MVLRFNKVRPSPAIQKLLEQAADELSRGSDEGLYLEYTLVGMLFRRGILGLERGEVTMAAVATNSRPSLSTVVAASTSGRIYVPSLNAEDLTELQNNFCVNDEERRRLTEIVFDTDDDCFD